MAPHATLESSKVHGNLKKVWKTAYSQDRRRGAGIHLAGTRPTCGACEMYELSAASHGSSVAQSLAREITGFRHRLLKEGSDTALNCRICVQGDRDKLHPDSA